MATTFPTWVVRQEGESILLEADWPSTIGYKYGLTATGTDAAVTEDTDHFYGGTGAIKLLTGSAAIGNTAEIKISHGHVDSRYVSFEMKWNMAATPTTQHIFFTITDSRVTDDKSYTGKIRFTPSSKKWQYESSAGTFKDFDPSIVTDLPHVDTAAGSTGDRWGWARLVIDTQEHKYNRFEASTQSGFVAIDMEDIDLVEASSPTNTELLFSVSNVSTAAAAHTAYTTDWCVCKL